jgi:nucleotide-binding universal stress UspA family protein
VVLVNKPVLVGADGSPGGLTAVDLAMLESRLRGLPVRVVCAAAEGEPPDRSRAALRAALDHATSHGGTGDVSGEVVAGEPGAVLVRESASAELAVVGHRGLGGFPDLVLGSVAGKLAAHARCPVLVTRGAGTPDADVAVGVDGSPASDAAVGFAFDEADLRGATLVALRAVTGPGLTGPSDVLGYDPRFAEAREVKLLADALARYHDEHPDVLVRRQVRWAPATGTLVDASRDTQLTVVGARGTGRMLGTRLGAVCHALLHDTTAPVAVVHAAPA